MRRLLLCLGWSLGFTMWTAGGPLAAEPGIVKAPFGSTRQGDAVDLFTLTNTRGMTAAITNYGGIVVKLTAPDREGRYADVVLGFEKLDDYLAGHPYFGAIIGRFGNRIGKGKFSLDGKSYTLATNNAPNHLHGGVKGFDKAVWKAESLRTPEGPALKLSHVSPDGDEGYPGALSTTVTYTLTDQNELRIDYHATTDAPTVVNLTHHSYFHLGGPGSGDVLKHELALNADRFTPVDANLIPTGELRSVEGSPLDFRKPTAIGARIDQDDEQIRLGGGYDHNFVINRTGLGLVKAAEVHEPTTGRVMEVWTTEPGVQFYTGNFLDGTNVGKGGNRYEKRSGFCLETQHYPDSPNQPAFPPTVLRPGQDYRSTTTYRFSAR